MRDKADLESVRLAELIGALVARHRSRVRPADGARAAPVLDRAPPRRAPRPRRGAAVGRLLHGAAHQRRVPHRRARAGQVVRRRHRAEGATSTSTGSTASGQRWPGCGASGPGHPALQRFRVGLNFALSGHKEVDGMVARHSAMARSLAAEIGLPDDGAGSRRRFLRAVGRQGLARRAEGRSGADRAPGCRSSPSSSRSPTARAGSRRPSPSPASWPAASSTPTSRPASRSAAGDILDGLGDASTWDEVIAAEPGARPSAERAGSSTTRSAPSPTSSTSSRPYTLGHARGVAQLVDAAGRQARARQRGR